MTVLSDRLMLLYLQGACTYLSLLLMWFQKTGFPNVCVLYVFQLLESIYQKCSLKDVKTRLNNTEVRIKENEKSTDGLNEQLPGTSDKAIIYTQP